MSDGLTNDADSKVVKLVSSTAGAKRNANPDNVIDLLEELLIRAKEGEYETIVLVGIRPDASFFTCSSGVKSIMQAVGALAIAQQDLMAVAKEV